MMFKRVELKAFGLDCTHSVYVSHITIILKSAIIDNVTYNITMYWSRIDNWCSDPPQLHGGVVHVSGKRTGSKAVYSCHPGYILFGHQV